MISLLEDELSVPCRARLLEAISALGAQVIPADAPKVHAPQLVVGGLGAGKRRLHPDLIAASERWPEVPVLVACDEELVQPVLRLQGGRLTLISQDLPAVPLGEALASCLQWAGVGTQVLSPTQGEDAHEHWWARVLVGGGPEVPQATMIHGRCLSAWLRPAESAHTPLPTAALEAWSRQVLSESMAPAAALIAAPIPPGTGAGVHLDPDGLALIQVAGPDWQVIISSPDRLPSWCPLHGSQLLATRAGDVLIVAWIPGGAAVAAVQGSGRTIAHELSRRWQGQSATALIIEVR